jgi:hypothetical protein
MQSCIGRRFSVSRQAEPSDLSDVLRDGAVGGGRNQSRLVQLKNARKRGMLQ